MSELCPTKFVQTPNSQLFCSICRQLFVEPVISVRCGHTFCKRCIFEKSQDGQTATCPHDGEVCHLKSLVLNRSLKAQIDDLDIFCCHGLRWSDSEEDYVCDPDGCDAQIKYSLRKEHEDNCQFGLVPCPNDAILCGKFRRHNLADHISVCEHHRCCYKNEGCEYVGTSENVASHVKTCNFRSSQGVYACQGDQVYSATGSSELRQTLNKLTYRVSELEQEKKKIMSQLEKTNSELMDLKIEQKKLNEKIDRILTQRLSLSSSSSSCSSQTSHTNSAVAINRNTSTSLSSTPESNEASTEVWTMPFQFKCIGTLRGHKHSILALNTHRNLLFSAGGDHVIKVWNLEELAHGCKHTMSGHTDKVHSLAVGRYLYSAGADKSIRAWSVNDFTEKMVKQAAHDDIIAALVTTSDYLFSSSCSVIKVWDATSLKPLHCMSGLKHWVRCLALGTNQDMLYSGSHNTIDIWQTKAEFNLRGKITHSFGSVYSLVITQLYIIAGTYNNNTHLFDVTTQNYLRKLSGHVGTIQSLTANSTGKFLFTASSDSKIQLWNLENNLLVQSLSRHEAGVNVIILHNDLLISGSEDTEIKMFKYFKMQIGFVPA